MAKLTFGMLMAVIWWSLHALQLDEERAMHAVHEAKSAVDRAAHAAAQQVDRDLLELGILTLDPERAETTAYAYLQANLRLDDHFSPLPDSLFREQVRVERLEVIGSEQVFPFTYRNETYDYEVNLSRPGVVLIVHLAFPRLFGVLSPIEWDLKGAAEMVFP